MLTGTNAKQKVPGTILDGENQIIDLGQYMVDDNYNNVKTNNKVDHGAKGEPEET